MADRRRVVIYHAKCWDGAGAAWAFQQHDAWQSADYIARHYGEAPPDVEGAHVAIVDFSFRREVLLEMYAAAETMVVLDHHETARAALEDLPFAHFDVTRSGAVLAWEYLFGEGSRMPEILAYIEDRDLWRFSLHCSRQISEYIRVHRCSPEAVGRLQEELIAHGVRSLANRGHAVLRRSELMIEEAVKHARDLDIAGVTGRITNLPVSGLISRTGNKLAGAHGTWGGTWFLDTEGILVSLRSRQGTPGATNCAQLAQKFGGGGHPGAAGFRVDVARFVAALQSGVLDP